MISFTIRHGKTTYDVRLYDKFTILRGDSATGKSSLCKAALDAITPGALGTVLGYDKVYVLGKADSIENIDHYSDYVIIADGDCALLHERELGKILRDSNNYFIFIIRKIKMSVPIHAGSVFVMQSSDDGRHHWFEPEFNTSQMLLETDQEAFRHR